MKKTIKAFIIMMMSLLLVGSSMFVASANENFAIVNGKKVSVGATITYTFCISDCYQRVTGMQIYFFFDQDALELIEATDGDVGGNTTINTNEYDQGRILYANGYMGNAGLDCDNRTSLAEIKFKVKKNCSSNITYFVQYLYDYNLIDIYDYKFTYDMLCNDIFLINGETPILADSSITNEIKFDDNFINNSKGEGTGLPTKHSEVPSTKELPKFISASEVKDFNELPPVKQPILPFILIGVGVILTTTMAIIKIRKALKDKKKNN